MKPTYLFSLLLLLWLSIVNAEIAVPALSQRVTDLTATFNTEQLKILEDKLAAFEARKGSQIAVLLLPTTNGEDIAAFGIRVADAWKIGRKDINDGVILIIAKDDRKLRLEVGRGLEGAIPDAIAKRVLAETIKPHFKNNDYFAGVDAGITQVIGLIDGEKLPEPSTENVDTDDGFVAFVIGFFFVAAIFDLIFSSVLGSLVGMISMGLSSALVAWLFNFDIWLSAIVGVVLFLLIKLIHLFGGGSGGSSGNSSWGSSDSSSWSSSSDSSWSGGGGDFGGGGASDSW